MREINDNNIKYVTNKHNTFDSFYKFSLLLFIPLISGFFIVISSIYCVYAPYIILLGILSTTIIVASISRPQYSLFLMYVLIFLHFRIPVSSSLNLSSSYLVIFILALIAFIKLIQSDQLINLYILIILLAIFIIFSLISLLNSAYFNNGLKQLLLWLLCSSVLIINVMFIKDYKSLRTSFSIIVILSFLSGLFGIFQIVFGNFVIGPHSMSNIIIHNIMPFFESNQTISFRITSDSMYYHSNWMVPNTNFMRLISIYFSPILASTVLASASIIAFSFYVYNKNNYMLLTFIILLISLVLTYTRGAYIAFSLTILLFLLFSKNYRSKGIKILFICLLVLIFFYWFYSFSSTTINTRLSIKSNASSKSVSIRYSYLLNGLNVFVNNPISGVGFGNYRNHIDPGNAHTEYPHNQFVQLAAETGIIGLVIYLTIILYILNALVKSYKRYSDKLPRKYLTAAILSFTLIGIHSFFEETLTLPIINILFWFSASIPFVLDRITQLDKMERLNENTICK